MDKRPWLLLIGASALAAVIPLFLRGGGPQPHDHGVICADCAWAAEEAARFAVPRPAGNIAHH